MKNKFTLVLILFAGLLSRSLSAQATYSDSLIQQERYAEDFIARIREIRDLPPKMEEKLKFVFKNKLKDNPYAEWGGTIREALQMVLPDTAIFSYLYSIPIKKEGYRLSAIEKINLVKLYHISKVGMSPASKLIDQKGYTEALISWTFAAFPTIRDSILRVAVNKYDSLIEALLLRDGSILRSNQFAVALKFKSQLGLANETIETLLFHALLLSRQEDSLRMKDPFGAVDFKKHEAKWMPEFLTEDQYTKVLSIWNKSRASIDAEDDWEEIKQRKIASSFDEKKVKAELFAYYLVKWNNYYRFANDPFKRREALVQLQKRQPKALKDLNSFRNQNKPAQTSDIKPQW